MQVSVEGYSLLPLMPRLFNVRIAADTDPLVIQGVYSADLIEPASVTDRPCIGRRLRSMAMRGKSFRGAACIEFAFITMALVPLLLGTGAAGINMILTLQTIQLAGCRHMYARGLDFSQAGNKTVLANVGKTLGLSTTKDTGSAVVILSALTYVDDATCVAGGCGGCAGPREQ